MIRNRLIRTSPRIPCIVLDCQSPPWSYRWILSIFYFTMKPIKIVSYNTYLICNRFNQNRVTHPERRATKICRDFLSNKPPSRNRVPHTTSIKPDYASFKKIGSRFLVRKIDLSNRFQARDENLRITGPSSCLIGTIHWFLVELLHGGLKVSILKIFLVSSYHH